ncbi:MAG: hypothetical protein JWL68_3860 [Actinomycetia bacterium]|nr:hypothetical protein [Actinomycetes bacterium]
MSVPAHADVILNRRPGPTLSPGDLVPGAGRCASLALVKWWCAT